MLNSRSMVCCWDSAGVEVVGGGKVLCKHLQNQVFFAKDTFFFGMNVKYLLLINTIKNIAIKKIRKKPRNYT